MHTCPYINIHTHRPRAGEWAISNLYNHFELVSAPGNYSIGIHPGYIQEDDPDTQCMLLKKYIKHTNVLAIGECGLDKLSATNLSLQEKIFRIQLQWANDIHKPIIIHCVKAFDEVLSILSDMRVTVPVIFHGFNKKITVAEKILGHGHYVSFGKALMHENTADAFSQVPDGTFFLETDDAPIHIETIYAQAAAIRKIPPEALILQMKTQAEKIFHTNIS